MQYNDNQLTSLVDCGKIGNQGEYRARRNLKM
ncbi:unnamed protein product, partial [marine sediment metagenome]